MSEAFEEVESHGTAVHEANGLHEQFTDNLEHASASEATHLASSEVQAETVPNLAVDGVAGAELAQEHAIIPPPEEVATAQSELASLGYCPGAVDGIYGWDTANATAEFQEMNNLPITGELDELTMEELADPEAVPNPLPCGAWDGPPIEVEGPGGVVIFVGEGHEHGHGGWHSDPDHHGWHDGHGHGG